MRRSQGLRLVPSMKNMIKTGLFLAVLLVFPSGWLSAQSLSYSLLGSDGPQPSPRFDGTIAYDPFGRRLFLFA